MSGLSPHMWDVYVQTAKVMEGFGTSDAYVSEQTFEYHHPIKILVGFLFVCFQTSLES